MTYMAYIIIINVIFNYNSLRSPCESSISDRLKRIRLPDSLKRIRLPDSTPLRFIHSSHQMGTHTKLIGARMTCSNVQIFHAMMSPV